MFQHFIINMDVNAEDPSKKRDSAQVEHGDGDKPKKVRVNRGESHRSPTRRLILRDNRSRESPGPTSKSVERSKSETSSSTAVSHRSRREDRDKGSADEPKIWDIESALLYLVQIDGDEKEYLSKHDDERPQWVNFRVGHAGDASTIATWYRQAITPQDNSEVEIVKPVDTVTEISEDDTTSSMLEVWLADGLGDEDTPPAVHALIARVHRQGDENTISTLGAVALFTLDWENEERVLQVQWMHIDPSLVCNIANTLQQRMWLRISALAQMTACSVITVDGNSILPSEAKDNAKERPSPSAE